MSTRPKIIISQQDARRLENLLNALSDDQHPTLADLEEELGRAEIMDEKDIPPTVVTMNSTVKFRTSSSKEVFCLTLVYPEGLDEAGKTISILAPVGGALLFVATENVRLVPGLRVDDLAKFYVSMGTVAPPGLLPR